jgi:hypothetical protein
MWKPLFAAGLCLTIVACTSSPLSGPDVLAGKAVGWPAAKGTVKVEAFTVGGSKGVLSTGPLGTDGSFRLALPKGNPVTPYLRRATGAFVGCPSVIVEPADLETVEWPAINVYDEAGGDTVGIITQGDADPMAIGAKVVFRLYAVQEGSVRGDCDGTTHDLTLHAGWNVITATRTAPSAVTVTSKAFSGGVEWRYVSDGSTVAAVRALAQLGRSSQ